MVSVNKNLCIGCGLCPSICDEVFELKGDKAVVKKGKENSKISCVKEAADSCPVKAIKA